jgi:hypothetical protein
VRHSVLRVDGVLRAEGKLLHPWGELFIVFIHSRVKLLEILVCVWGAATPHPRDVRPDLLVCHRDINLLTENPKRVVKINRTVRLVVRHLLEGCENLIVHFKGKYDSLRPEYLLQPLRNDVFRSRHYEKESASRRGIGPKIQEIMRKQEQNPFCRWGKKFFTKPFREFSPSRSE